MWYTPLMDPFLYTTVFQGQWLWCWPIFFNFNCGLNFLAINGRDFIFGMTAPLMKPFLQKHLNNKVSDLMALSLVFTLSFDICICFVVAARGMVFQKCCFDLLSFKKERRIYIYEAKCLSAPPHLSTPPPGYIPGPIEMKFCKRL